MNHVERYLEGSISFIGTRLACIGYHRNNASAPLLTQAEWGKVKAALEKRGGR
jgi:hypothetical protein